MVGHHVKKLNNMQNTIESLNLIKKISDEINNMTFHHHYYILYDVAKEFGTAPINYVEIGCYAGGSACLMLQRPNTNVISIDLGIPISSDIVKENVKKLNILNNHYNYIQGNSQKIQTVNELKNLIQSIDILFIDGDHSYNGVINDFNLYSKMVKPGGYIVFDDYNDKQHSPQVKVAVDDLLKNNYEYEIFGTLPNVFGARPSELKEGNCFIIKKK
jgi:predicted O-methyltransferase YrrM